MDYDEMAMALLNKMQLLQKLKSLKNISDIMQGEAFVLGYIAQHGGYVLPGEISHEMDVSSARIATALNGLEKKGLITRQIDTNDRRRILVGITEEGKSLAEKHQKTMLGHVAEVLELLGENDALEFVRIMNKLARTLQDWQGHTNK